MLSCKAASLDNPMLLQIEYQAKLYELLQKHFSVEEGQTRSNPLYQHLPPEEQRIREEEDRTRRMRPLGKRPDRK